MCIRDSFGVARTLNGRGETLRAAGQHEAAETVYCQAIELIEALGNPEQEAILRTNLGLAQLERQDLDAAFHTLHTAAQQFQALGTHTFEAVVLAQLSALEARRKAFDDCEQWLNRLEQLPLERPLADRDYAQALSEAAAIAFTAEQTTLARRLYLRAEEAIDLLGDKETISAIQDILVDVRQASVN